MIQLQKYLNLNYEFSVPILTQFIVLLNLAKLLWQLSDNLIGFFRNISPRALCESFYSEPLMSPVERRAEDSLRFFLDPFYSKWSFLIHGAQLVHLSTVRIKMSSLIQTCLITTTLSINIY